MKHWTEGFHQQLRETHHAGQIDIFQELEIHPPFRPNVRCKGCGIPWNGEDARSTPQKAKDRACWYVSNSVVRCPSCHMEKMK